MPGPVRAPLLPLLAAAALIVAACAAPRAAFGTELTVFAAASLTEPFAELGPLFGAANNGARVAFNFGGTPALRTQLEQGARADIFVSANREQMDAAVKSGIVVGEAPVFVQNKLVVILSRENPGRVEKLQDLARPGLKLVTSARTVPVGIYTQDALAKMSRDASFGVDFQRKVTANIRSEEADVKQVVAKVRLGEADAAVVYATDVSPAVSPEVKTIEVPHQFNTIAEYPISWVTDARQPELAKAFIAYVLSGPGRDVMKKFNFAVPEKSTLARLDLRA